MSISHMERCFFDGCKVDVYKFENEAINSNRWVIYFKTCLITNKDPQHSRAKLKITYQLFQLLAFFD